MRGRVEQSNFNNYRMLRMDEAPPIEVHLVDSTEEAGRPRRDRLRGCLPRACQRGVRGNGQTRAPPADRRRPDVECMTWGVHDMRRLVGFSAPSLLSRSWLLAAFVAWRLYDRDPEVSAADVPATPALIARGDYLVQRGRLRRLPQRAGQQALRRRLRFRLPFGTIYSTNITPDKETGIGTWSDDDFVRALHQGIAKDGTHLYPAFPYASYTGLSRDDAVAMKAYLFSLPPVHAPARANELAFPFNQRWTLAFWNLAFLDEHRFSPIRRERAARTAAPIWQRRSAIAANATRRATSASPWRSGGSSAAPWLQGWHAYNITTDKDYGIGGWSDQQIADYLVVGHAEGRGSASGPDGRGGRQQPAISDGRRYKFAGPVSAACRAADRRARHRGRSRSCCDDGVIGLGAGQTDAQGADAQGDRRPGRIGRRLFEGVCASCHEWNGGGRETNYAALAGSQAVNDPEGVNLVRVLLSGGDLKTSHGTAYMPSFARAYNDVELAAVSNYVIGHFGGKAGRVTPELVKERGSSSRVGPPSSGENAWQRRSSRCVTPASAYAPPAALPSTVRAFQ